MIPTKPIRPLTATAAAVPAVAATTTMSRTRRTSSPRLAASSSPRLSTSSTRRWSNSSVALTTMYGDGQGPAGAAGGPVRDRHRRPESGARGDAEQVRVGEGVAEHPLVGRARDCEHPADERSEDDARGPQLPQDRVLGTAERRMNMD